MEQILEMKHICKYFPGVRANHNVNLEVRKGEVHALLGENGAGKSTLMNVLYGLSAPTSGEILFQGQAVRLESPKDAIALGIGMVHQHFMLIPALSVVENVVLGMKPERGVTLNLHAAAQRLTDLAKQYGMEIDPWALVETLTVGQQQRLEILKALYRGADLLILDEPTAVLTPQEVEELFHMIRSLTGQGHTVILITHKLREVMEICDRITVLRLGESVATLNKADTTPEELSCLMVGRNVDLTYHKSPVRPGEPVLELRQVCCTRQGVKRLDGVDLTLRRGEILGVAGVDGNGQTELVDAIAGLVHVDSGQILLRGAEITNHSPRSILDAKASHIPEDRHKRGVILPMTLTENAMMMDYYKPPYAHGFLLQWKEIEARTDKLLSDYQVKATSRDDLMQNLSGGNQQKVVLGREMMRNPDLLIAMHPARGLDIGATDYVHRRILAERDDGKAVLLISTELDEILTLSDRVAVLYEGKIMGIVTPDTPVEIIGLLMAGAQPA